MKNILTLVLMLTLASTLSANIYALPTTYHVWGAAGDIPQLGDFDGDGKIDPAIFRPNTGQWFVLSSRSGFTSFVSVSWGMAGDQPIAGDYEGIKQAQVAVWRPSTGEWLVYGAIFQVRQECDVEYSPACVTFTR